MDRLREIWNLGFQGVTVGDGATLVGILLAALIVRKIFQSIILDRLRKLADRTRTDIDDHLIQAVERPVGALIILVGFRVAFAVLRLPSEPLDVQRFLRVLIIVLITLDVTWLFIRLTDVLTLFLAKMTQKTESTLDDQLVPLIRKTVKVVFAILAFVVVVQNLGYQVTGLLAGLGIGGLAFALAAQTTLSNLFGSVTIILDRPFRVGELVSGDGFLGVIEEIGLRSTRVRTLDKTMVTVPNAKLADMTVDNLTQRSRRRVRFTLGVTYETDADRMERALERIRAVLEAREDAEPGSIVVRFAGFGDSSLDILVQFLSIRTDWAEYLTVRQEVNLAIMRELEALGLEVAFPTRTVYFRQEDSWGPDAAQEPKSA
ncbi:MAG: mechanosensitive ion channel family protein [Candidatus Eisenbacteria bacterium]|nr:mechanosensitive ion channel family protein [Candidatus Eisenbacteria bacterium]